MDSPVPDSDDSPELELDLSDDRVSRRAENELA